MPHARTLRELLDEALQATPPADQIDVIGRFMPGSNIELLRHSLKELRAVAKRKDQTDLPTRLHKVYHRKLAEQASLYPILHIFESAYRTKLAFWMEEQFRTMRWWLPHLARLRELDKLGRAEQVESINKIPITHGTGRVIENLIKNVEGDRLDRGILDNATGHEVLSLAKMSDVEELIHEQWAVIKGKLPSVLLNGSPLDEAVFKGKFKRVREARNQAYHHREVVKRNEIAGVAEELLDLIDVHLCSALDFVAHAGVKGPKSMVQRAARHISLADGLTQFEVDCMHEKRDPTRMQLQATSGGDAIARSLAALSGDDRTKLTAVAVVLNTE